MSRWGRASVMFFLGLIAAGLIWTGDFGWFVQQRMQIPLALAALVLLAFGGYEVAQLWRVGATDDGSPEQPDDHDHDAHDHEHAAGPSVGWMLLLPLFVLLAVAPTGLGAAAAQRVDAYVPQEASGAFGPLDESGEVTLGAATRASAAAADELGPATDEADAAAGPARPGSEDGAETGAIEMRVFDFLDRAVWDPNRSLEGRVVRLEGLVVNDPVYPDGFRLTRFLVSCCAADGIPLQVAIRGIPERLEDDTWVVADVIWRPPDVPYEQLEGAWVVEADAVAIIPVTEGPPKDPYESPY